MTIHNNKPSAETLYSALLSDGQRLGELRRLQYRCENRRCQLLDAIAVVDTILLHQKRFKYSNDVNARVSNEAGRKANTYDGANHWYPRTYFVGESALAYPEDGPAMRLGIQCDHVGVLQSGEELTLSAEDSHADWDAGYTEMVVRNALRPLALEQRKAPVDRLRSHIAGREIRASA